MIVVRTADPNAILADLLWIELRLQPYDVAPFYILAPETGARVTDWSGVLDPAGGSIVIAPPSPAS